MRSVPRVSTDVVRAVAIVMLAFVGAFASAGAAQAHTELESTVPAADSQVDAPVERLELVFTRMVTPLGEAVEVTGPDGPVELAVDQGRDGLVVTATPAAPLGPGAYAVEWTVAAEDGHPLTGTYSFTVVATAGAATPTAMATPGTTPTPAATHTAPPTVEPSANAQATASATAQEPVSAEPQPASDTAAQIVVKTGSAVALWSFLAGAGALVFAALAMRREPGDDVRRVLALTRWSGVALVAGVLMRWMGRAAVIAGGSLADALDPDALSAALQGSLAWVMGLQVAGGLLMIGVGRTVAASWLAMVGVALAGAGQVWGGHSGSAEPRWLIVVADVAHLAAGAVWLGGVTALAWVLRVRRRAGREAAAGHMAARFGVVAASAAVTVGVAGVVLAALLLDEVSQLWTTPWGVALLVKAGLVAVVGIVGAWTHFRVVPALARRADASEHAISGGAHGRTVERLAEHLRTAARIETALFAAIVVATVVLVTSTLYV